MRTIVLNGYTHTASFCPPPRMNMNVLNDCIPLYYIPHYTIYYLYPNIISYIITTDASRLWDNPFRGMLRLTGTNFVNEGRVEVYCNGQWGTICNLNFDANDRRVICQQLGYNGAFDTSDLTLRQEVIIAVGYLQQLIHYSCYMHASNV